MSDSSPRLPAEINSATRTLHTRLNTLITSRLPLSLPPYSTTPLTYANGLLPFASIYLIFESTWDELHSSYLQSSFAIHASPSSIQDSSIWVDISLESQSQEKSFEQDITQAPSQNIKNLIAPDFTSTTTTKPPSSNLLAALNKLIHADIRRTQRLRADITTLFDLSSSPSDTDVDNVTAYIQSVKTPVTMSLDQHIRDVLMHKPHLIVAYTFIMYMAIFSGGRYIRAELAGGGQDFWKFANNPPQHYDDMKEQEKNEDTGTRYRRFKVFSQDEQHELSNLGLSFWFWDGQEDGADIKANFKSNLDAIESLLTTQEKKDIIEESAFIFEQCEQLVAELDENIGRQGRLITGFRQRESAYTPTLPDKILFSSIWKAGTKWQDRADIGGLIAWTALLGSAAWFAAHHLNEF